MRVITCLVFEHNLWLVALAAVVCVAGSWVSFDLFQRARERRGVQQYGWLYLTGVATGSLVWCTHFIAMLAYEASAPISYDPIVTMLSLVIAVPGCSAGFAVAAKAKFQGSAYVGGGLIGLSVAAMHYTGMMAYHIDGFVTWDPAHVVASVLAAIVLGALAVNRFVTSADRVSHFLALALFVGSVVSLHFTGMAAIAVVPLAGETGTESVKAMQAMAVAVAGVALIIAVTAIMIRIDTKASAEVLEICSVWR